SPTSYFPSATGAERLCHFRDGLNAGALLATEPWPYVPHVTVANLPNPGQTRSDLQLCAARWKNYSGPRRFLVNQLVVVREEPSGRWLDLARFSLESEAAARLSPKKSPDVHVLNRAAYEPREDMSYFPI